MSPVPDTQNVNSPAKRISDIQLCYERLMRSKADYTEMQRLGLITISDEHIATIDAWILEIRAMMKFGS